jgi:hypothetical protein
MIAAATARQVVSQFVLRNAGGMRASEARKSMSTARIAAFRITITMNVGISAGCAAGVSCRPGQPWCFPSSATMLRLILPLARRGILTLAWVSFS